MSRHRGFFVAGTDTGVGKTVVTCALLHAFARLGRSMAVCKPISAGIENGQQEDVVRLQASYQAVSGRTLSARDVGPVQLTLPCAPEVAAAAEGRSLARTELEPLILGALDALSLGHDGILVEGVGGFRVPLTPDWDTADLACLLGLPVILVVGIRLGCLNHALLTAEAIAARGIAISGWVANCIDPSMLVQEDTVCALDRDLQRAFNARCLGRVPFLANEISGPLHTAHTASLSLHLDPLFSSAPHA